MLKNILDGVKEVLVELGGGMSEAYETISIQSSKVFADLNAKLMGSYEEIEAFEESKALVAETEQ